VKIRPAGMSLARAMEIAMQSPSTAPTHDLESENGNGFRLSQFAREEILRLSADGWSVGDVALEVGVTGRTVTRVRSAARDDWLAGEKRRQNLESFRHMTEEWAS